jgi:hypothetical protein
VDKQKESGALVNAASIVAAIRLRGQEVKPSPKLTATIKDSVDLARRVLAEINKMSEPATMRVPPENTHP